MTFAKFDDNSISITIDLNGTTASASQPAHIHNNTAAEGGGIAIDITSVDGTTGESVTVITQTNDGVAITYEQLIDFDGYVNIHNSADDLGTLLAQGDIGQNKLTGEFTEYEFLSDDPNVSGTFSFWERVNGETLAIVDIEGDGDRDSHIHGNSAAEGGGILIDLNHVVAGKSKTNVSVKNDDTPITYDELLEFDGYLNIHGDAGALIAQTDIGQNALTGNSVVYPLDRIAGVTGTVTFAERNNGETLVRIQLIGTQAGNNHPCHIHNNDAATGGNIAVDLNNVNGNTGRSVSNVTQLNNGTPIDYAGMINYNGYINVHTSSTNLGTLVAQGDIGSNG
ncbi:MAG: CHRD domain-containing protein [Bacteroidetes bacterium]|nr:CHRD domain-containing protein [Bacteroidota bacterium]